MAKRNNRTGRNKKPTANEYFQDLRCLCSEYALYPYSSTSIALNCRISTVNLSKVHLTVERCVEYRLWLKVYVAKLLLLLTSC